MLARMIYDSEEYLGVGVAFGFLALSVPIVPGAVLVDVAD